MAYERRTPLKPLHLLETEIDALENDLRKLTSINISQYSSDLDYLHQMIIEIKAIYRRYSDASRHIVDRLTPSSITRALEFKERRNELHADIVETIKLTNALRLEQQVELESNISAISTAPHPYYSSSCSIAPSSNTIMPFSSNIASPCQPNLFTPENRTFNDQLYTMSKESNANRVASYLKKQASYPDPSNDPIYSDANSDFLTSHSNKSQVRTPPPENTTNENSFPTDAPDASNELYKMSLLENTVNEPRTSESPFRPIRSPQRNSLRMDQYRDEYHVSEFTNNHSRKSAFRENENKRILNETSLHSPTRHSVNFGEPLNNSLSKPHPFKKPPVSMIELSPHCNEARESLYHDPPLKTLQYSSNATVGRPDFSGPNGAHLTNNHHTKRNPNPTYDEVYRPRHVFNSNVTNLPNPTVGRHAPPLPYNAFNADPTRTDAPTFHLLRQELFNKSTTCFAGEPHRYYSWVNTISHKIKGLQLEPWDILTILNVNTTGKPQKLIETHMDIGGADPLQTLSNVWVALYEQFGSSAKIGCSLYTKVNDFPLIKSANDSEKLLELISLCQLITCNITVCQELECFNLARGTRLVWNKLPQYMKHGWRKFVGEYKSQYNRHPPFDQFVKFLISQSRDHNEPDYAESSSYNYSQESKVKHARSFTTNQEDPDEYTFTTSVQHNSNPPTEVCPLHESSRHVLTECKAFDRLGFQEKKTLLFQKGRCFRCLGKHLRVNCKEDLQCDTCGGDHLTTMHRHSGQRINFNNRRHASPEEVSSPNNSNENSNLCTSVCRDRSNVTCSKVVLVDITIPSRSPKSLRCYCIVDEQSSSSFIDPKVIKYFDVSFPFQEYNLTTLTGLKTSTSGMVTNGFKVRGISEKHCIDLPEMYTNEHIPDCRDEVAAPDVVRAHRHVSNFARYFPPVDHNAEVLLLIGRDCGEAMATSCHGHRAPFAHHTAVGWALVGPVCLGIKSNNNTVLKVRIDQEHLLANARFTDSKLKKFNELSPIFKEYPDDELEGRSKEDERFLTILDKTIHTNNDGNISMPLPFKNEILKLPDNKYAVFHRTSNTLSRLKRDSDKLQQCLQSMGRNIDSNHVEPVPQNELTPRNLSRVWYIPVFPVYQHKKNKVRLVFDSSAVFQNASLNQELLQGPDINNQLRTVLIRFRNGEVGFSADIEAMFHMFNLNEEDRDFTRFYWWRDNDPSKELIEYRARVHIFGNKSSPALANVGLRYAVTQSPCSEEVKKLVFQNFYVDDACGCANSPEVAIRVLNETRSVLQNFNIRLHKICSNSTAVTKSFPPSERAECSPVIDFSEGKQQTLGVQWNTSFDRLVIRTNVPNRPFTKRGILATTNSTFDPLGIVAPIILAGRILQRSLIPSKKSDPDLAVLDWDDPLPQELLPKWEAWKESLIKADSLISVPRGYLRKGFSPVVRQELHVFSDASTDGTGHVIYIRSFNQFNKRIVAFVIANSRVSPRADISIPRLELCAAVDSSIAAQQVAIDLNISPKLVTLYCDSKVVLGYLSNESKRFSRYVTRRINLITKCFPNSQWKYIPTKSNPADIASRPQNARSLIESCWLKGPDFLWSDELSFVEEICSDDVDLPETDVEISNLKADSSPGQILSNICLRTNDFNKIISVMKIIFAFTTKVYDLTLTRKGAYTIQRPIRTVEHYMRLTILLSQHESFPKLLMCLRLPNKPANQIPNNLLKLSPFLDSTGMIRVGGRLKNSNLSIDLKHPYLVSSTHPIANQIIGHYHKLTKHQGRHISLGAIREAGFFIEHGSGLVKKFINTCVTCRKLRRLPEEQKMSDLPADRLHESPPFTYCGMDVFGPFIVVDGKATRRTNSEKKSWGLVFTCLVSRAIHVEPLPALDTSTFKNALRRFFCIRGKCVLLRSDQGTNFIGARNQDVSDISFTDIKAEIKHHQCEWKLNPPKASHFGGVWERKIKSIKCILNASLRELGPRTLNRDELHTFFQEAASIVNNTPMWEISGDANDPYPLTPAMLLTMKDNSNPSILENFTEKDLNAYGSRRHRRIQFLSDQFWRRWRHEYIHHLQSRTKWVSKKRSVVLGDIVLMKDKGLKRNHWPMARVTETKNSDDGLVRSVTLLLPSRNGSSPRTLIRPISDIILLLEQVPS